MVQPSVAEEEAEGECNKSVVVQDLGPLSCTLGCVEPAVGASAPAQVVGVIVQVLERILAETRMLQHFRVHYLVHLLDGLASQMREVVIGHEPGSPASAVFLCVHSAALPSREQALHARSMHSNPLRIHEAHGLVVKLVVMIKGKRQSTNLTPSHRILSRLQLMQACSSLSP